MRLRELLLSGAVVLSCSGPGPVDGTGGGGAATGGGATGGGAAGAGFSGGMGGGGSEPAFDAGQVTLFEYCQRVAEIECGCEAAKGRLLPQDAARCLAWRDALCLGSRAAALDAGQRRFDGFAAKRCEDAGTSSFSCDFRCGYDVFPRAGVTGTPCADDFSCAPGFQCPVEAPACGACVPERGEGETCTQQLTCVQGPTKNPVFECLPPPDGGPARCVAPLAALGDWCTGRACAQDAGVARCVDGVCRGVPGLGERCEEFGFCREGNCRFDGAASYLCVASFPDGDPCATHLDCTSQLCVRPPDAGASRCAAPGAACDLTSAGSCLGGNCDPRTATSGACFGENKAPDGVECTTPFVCASECLAPVDGGARRCTTPIEGAPCLGAQNCGAKQGCYLLDGGTRHCFSPSREGEACIEVAGTLKGSCEDVVFVDCWQGRCQRIPDGAIARGELCSTTANCSRADYCPSGAAPRCQPRIDAGAACAPGTECAPGLVCISGTCRPYGANGDACTRPFDPIECLLFNTCLNQFDGGFRCRPIVGPGDTCDARRTLATCQASWCDGDAGLCRPPLPVGAACTQFDQCTCRQPDGGADLRDGGRCLAPATCP